MISRDQQPCSAYGFAGVRSLPGGAGGSGGDHLPWGVARTRIHPHMFASSVGLRVVSRRPFFKARWWIDYKG